MPEHDDELLSINQVARLWGSGLQSVLERLATDDLRSLDRGLLVAEERHDVAMIRRSWAEALQHDSPAANRRLDSGGSEPHPAAPVAYEFHKNLDLQDAEGVWRVSSVASQASRDPQQLLQVWLSVGAHLVAPGAGVGTAIYSLEPVKAVAARVFAETPALPRPFEKPTPAALIDAFPLVEEGTEWKVDLDLFEHRAEWIHLLSSPLPASEDPVSE